MFDFRFRFDYFCPRVAVGFCRTSPDDAVGDMCLGGDVWVSTWTGQSGAAVSSCDIPVLARRVCV